MAAITVIKAARLLDGTPAPPVIRPCLVVEGEEILGIFGGDPPPQLLEAATSWIDLPRATLLPGLIDSHVHLNQPGDGTSSPLTQSDEEVIGCSARRARLALGAGITALRDCGGRASTTLDARRELASDAGTGPHLVLCGPQITVPCGRAWRNGAEAQGPDALRARVHELVSRGADFIKVMGSGGGTPGTHPWQSAYIDCRRGTSGSNSRFVYGQCLGKHGEQGQRLLLGVDPGDHGLMRPFGASPRKQRGNDWCPGLNRPVLPASSLYGVSCSSPQVLRCRAYLGTGTSPKDIATAKLCMKPGDRANSR